jgi:hypothetical protein
MGDFRGPANGSEPARQGIFLSITVTYNYLCRAFSNVANIYYVLTFLVLNIVLHAENVKILLFNIILQGAGFCNQFPGFTYLS